MHTARLVLLSAFVSAFLAVLTACGHGHASHVLPPSAGLSSGGAGGGTAGKHRRPRTINEAAYPNAVLLDHPVAFYRLDDTGSTMIDAGPNGLTGAYGSSVTHGAGALVPNTIDPATTFAGGSWSASKIATVGQNSALQPANVSIEAWVSEQVANSGGFIDLVSYGSQSGSGQGYTLQLTPSNTLSVYLNTTTGGAYAAGSTVLTPGSAYHIVATYDGSNAKIYVNGLIDGSSTGGSISYAGIGSYGLSLGAAQNTSRNVFNGTLDDVSIFNSALTSTQVSTHYAAAQSFPDDPYADTVLTDLPVAYYRLDDAGTTMYDATNNRYNGNYGSSITKRVTGLVSNSTDTAATFPGGTWSANSIATVPQNSALQPTAITIEGWIKETAANSGGTIDLVSYGPQTGLAYSLQISSSNTLNFTLSTTGTPSTISLAGTTTLTAGTAYYVAATWDGYIARLYLNGNQDASTPGSGNISYAGIGTYGLSLGATQSTTRNVFNGTLDEVAIYNTALSSTRIAAHSLINTWTASQAGPPHILTMAYYEPGRDGSVSLQYMLRHVDWAETASGDFSLSNAFRNAGGMHVSSYSDPTTMYFCSAPFGPTSYKTPGPCALPYGPEGDPTLDTDESAWLHGSTAVIATPPTDNPAPAGARLHRYQSSVSMYGEELNPGWSHVKTAYANDTANKASSNRVDAFFMDDSAPHYSPAGFTYSYGTTSSEYDALGDTQYRNDIIALACKAARPVFFNGPSWDALDTVNGPTEKADDTAMLSSPCVLGVSIEGTFVGGFRKSLNQHAESNTFIPAADNALLAQTLGKTALILNYISCSYGTGGCTFDPTGDRIYGLAGIWLIYDPRYTLAWNGVTQEGGDPNMVDGDNNWDGLVAEYNIVPTQPYQTATGTNITTLQIANGHTGGSGNPAGGAFRREFAQCYQNGASIGRCAVVLNAESPDYTSGGVVSMPTLGHSYSSSLVLNDAPADAGGTATWTGTVPTSLQPMTAVILKQ